MSLEASSVSSYKKFPKLIKYSVVTAVIVLYIALDSIQIDFSVYDFSSLYKLNLFFWGIFIQAFPFLLAGSLLSSVIQLFAGQDKLNFFLRKSGYVSSILPLAASFILPACDCSSVTVAAGFVKKNLPLKSIIIYLLSAPILNPIAIISTIVAFPGKYEIVIIRIILGIITAIIVGNILDILYSKSSASYISEKYFEQQTPGCAHCCAESVGITRKSFFAKTRALLVNTGEELFHVLPFVIAGVLVSSLFQTLIPKSAIEANSIYAGIIFQTLIMLFMAFILSVCSTSDAFIARSFSTHFAIGPLLGFMVFGPMIDVKSIIVLSSYFKKQFVAVFSLVTFFITFLLIILASCFL